MTDHTTKDENRQVVRYEIELVSDVQTEEVKWLWNGRVPLGKLVLIDGDPTLGKSTIAFDLAAKVTRGESMPEGPEIEAGGVVLITPEDDVADTIRPRLEAAGADITKVATLSNVTVVDEKGEKHTHPFLLSQDMEALEFAIQKVNARLVVIDPVMHVLSGKTDSHRDQDVRKALGPLVELAKRTPCSVVCVMHLNKGQHSNAMYRTSGSIAFVALARSTLRAVVDPDNPDEGRVLVHYKGNLSKPAASLRYEVVDTPNHQPRIKWLGESTRSRNELLMSNAVFSDSTQDILRVFQEKKEQGIKELSTKEVAEELDKEPNTVNRQLNRLVGRGLLVRPSMGKFSLPDRAGLNLTSLTEQTTSVMSEVSGLSESDRQDTSINVRSAPGYELLQRNKQNGNHPASVVSPSPANGYTRVTQESTCEHGVQVIECEECSPF